MNLVDESCAQVLLNRSNAPANPNVLAFRSLGGPPACGVDSIRHEMEGRSTLHFYWRPRMVGQDKRRSMKWRNVSPPTFPGLIRPRPAHRAEHVSPHDPRADVLEAPRSKVIAYPR